MTDRVDWLVFGDDWGRLPSTTQHLVRHLPAGDRVVWIDSIGMRRPRLTTADARRAIGKLTGRARAAGLAPRAPIAAALRRVSPSVVPVHRSAAIRRLNAATLRRSVGAAQRALGVSRPVALLSNPVGVYYVDAVTDPARVAYLRLDDYAGLPGVDAPLVAEVERRLLARADLVVSPSAALVPRHRGLHLPQGVDLAHFGQVPLSPPVRRRVLGFYGSSQRWLDLALVAAVAEACPDWTLELVGPLGAARGALRRPNVRVVGPLPYAELPARLAGWSASWLPFAQGGQIPAASPLKLRELLAAGLPVACTDFPAARELGAVVTRVAGADSVRHWLDGVVARDDPAARAARRATQADAGWGARAARLREAVRPA